MDGYEFPKTTLEENLIAAREGFRIFGEMAKRYGEGNVRDLDIILNSLCFALIRMCELNSNKKDYKIFIDLVNNILNKNLLGEA